MIFAGILAGGTGSRMETAVMPKQFLPIAGVPIFIRTLNTFLSVDEIDKVIVSINTQWREKYEELMEQFHVDQERVVLTAGGDSRFESLKNVTQCAYDLCGDDASVIVTHDCARPFVSTRIIKDNIYNICHYDMITTSLPTIDTMLWSEDGEHCTSVPDRTKLWNDQGPQTYLVSDFLKYYALVPKEELPGYIEAGKLYRSQNKKIGIVKGDRMNFKITNDIDLQYAEFLLERGFVK